MNPFAMFFVALALAMDAFAVSVASGLAARKFHVRHGLIMGLWFGGFQALMPFLGWLGGMKVRNVIADYDHWIAFGLLSAIGIKMVLESFEIQEVEERPGPPQVPVMLLLAVATSIDALAVGLSLAALGVSILAPVVVIGGVTFAASFGGVWIGSLGIRFFEKRVEMAGGLILIAIGVRILVSHIWF